MTINYDSFCKKCKHYDFTLSDGILCGLTHTKPAFEDECNDFVLDSERENQLIREEKIHETRIDRIEKYKGEYSTDLTYLKCKECGKDYPSGNLYFEKGNVCRWCYKKQSVYNDGNDTSTEHQNKYYLKEHFDGSFCSDCNLVFFEKVGKCNECNAKTEPTKWYSRFCLERIVFIVTLVIVSFILGPFFSDEPESIFLAPLLTAILLFSAYYSAKYFLGIGGFTEKFHENNVPQRAYKRFSFSRYFSEIFRLIGILIALSAIFAIIRVIRWAIE